MVIAFRCWVRQIGIMPNLRVALFVETSREYGRGLLRGITRYQQEHGPWSIYFKPQGLEDSPPPWLARWKGDGILARIDNRCTAEAVIASGVPALDLRASLRDLGLPTVGIDNKSVVKIAIDHFLAHGHRHFAFYGTPQGENYYQDMRATIFSKALKSRGFDCDIYRASYNEPNWDREQAHLASWLRALPKPIAIMACHDDRGQQLVDACLRENLAVPDEIAILGVDNDPILCSLSNPPLSSIDVNADTIGYEAAAQLDRMMKGQEKNPRDITLVARGIVIRQSTDVMAMDDSHVVQCMRLIRKYACSGMGVADIVKRVPISRTALSRRFKKLLGHSPKAEIIRLRIQQAKELLCETPLPVSDVAEKIGYAEAKYFIEVFRRNVGATPLQYRKKFGKKSGRRS